GSTRSAAVAAADAARSSARARPAAAALPPIFLLPAPDIVLVGDLEALEPALALVPRNVLIAAVIVAGRGEAVDGAVERVGLGVALGLGIGDDREVEIEPRPYGPGESVGRAAELVLWRLRPHDEAVLEAVEELGEAVERLRIAG